MRAGGPGNRGAVAAPLVAERRRTRRHDAEGGALADLHALARRLRGDARGKGRCRHRQHRRAARGAADRVAHHHRKGRTTVGARGRGRRVGDRIRAGDRAAVPLPLVGEGRTARRADTESRALAHRDGLVGGLGADRGRHGRRAHGQHRRRALYAPGRVADDHGEQRAVVIRDRRVRVARVGGAGDGAAILVPLVGERLGAFGDDREIHGIADPRRLARRLRNDGGCDRGAAVGRVRVRGAAGGEEQRDKAMRA